MHFSQRLIAAVVLVALSGVLGACSTANFDPTDLLDFLDSKKKLPGERKPVFPEGVPGIEQGVPRDLYKGASQDQLNPPTQAVASAPPPEEPKAKRPAKSRARKPPATANAPTDITQQPAAAEAAPVENGGEGTVPPAPKPKKIVRRRTTAPPPDQPAAAQPGQVPQPAQPQQTASPFPAPLPSGTLTR